MKADREYIHVAAGILWRRGRFLAARRPEGKPRSGFWEFPGGKREAGENMEQALRRELREELNIECLTIVPWKTLTHTYSDMRVKLYFMHVTGFSGEPVANDGQILRWITPEEALCLPFLPADRAVISRLSPPAP